MTDRNDERDADLLDSTLQRQARETDGLAAGGEVHAATDEMKNKENVPGNEETEGKQSSKDRDVADAKKALAALKNLTADEEDSVATREKMTLSAILGGDMLGGKWFRKQFGFIVMLTAMAIVYVSNRYYCQQEMLETKALNDTLLDRRYKALTQSSQLKEKMLRSRIEASLKDSTLQTANTPSYNLKVE